MVRLLTGERVTMRNSLALMLVALMWSASAAAQSHAPHAASKPAIPKKSAIPSRAFAAKSLNALTSTPTAASARWLELAHTKTTAIMAAFAAAERKGWKPTSTTTLMQRNKPGVRPVSVQEYLSSGDGEMLVWDWDDGNADNGVEGLIYFRSFATGNEITFAVQINAPVYDQTELPYYEAFDATSHETYGGGNAPLPAAFFTGLQRGPGPGPAKCSERSLLVAADCMKRRIRERVRDGVRNAAVDAGIGGVMGCRATRTLAGCLAGAGAGAGTGFISGVIGSMIWGTDFECRREGNDAYDRCIIEYEECVRSGRAGCSDRE
jgi:hypothetical protein